MSVKVYYKGYTLEFESHPSSEQIVEEYDRVILAQKDKQEIDQDGQRNITAKGSEEYPLSFSQESFWFLHKQNPKLACHHIPFALRLKGELDPAVLIQALENVIKRQKSLSTSLEERNGVPYQVIHSNSSLCVQYVDLSLISNSKKEEMVSELATEQSLMAFDLKKVALFRVALLKLSDSEHMFLCSVHHIVSDGPSISIFIHDLVDSYNSILKCGNGTLQSLFEHYPDFVLEQRRRAEENIGLQEKFWLSYLSGVLPTLSLPTDRQRPAHRSFQCSSYLACIEENARDQLANIAKSHRTTLYVTLLSAFTILLYRYTGQEDIIVGSPVSLRRKGKDDETLGCYINTLPLRFSAWGNPAFSEFLDRVRISTMEALKFREYPFNRMVEKINPKRDPGVSPLFQVMLSYQSSPLRPYQLLGLDISALRLADENTEYDITLDILDTGKKLELYWQYSEELFDVESIERMAECFSTLIDSIVKDSELPVSELQLIPQRNLRVLLSDWSQSTKCAEPIFSVYELIKHTADKLPDLVAVQYEEKTLTYCQLHKRASQLAGFLRNKGLTSGGVVGVCLDKPPEIVVCFLAILEVGGVYLYLDHTLPRKRLKYMVTSANVDFVVTESALYSSVENDDEDIEIVELESNAFAIEQSKFVENCFSAAPEDPAYIVFTSGTEAMPIGIQITHGSLSNAVSYCSKNFCIENGEDWFSVSPFALGISVVELSLALANGARIVFPIDKAEAERRGLNELVTSQARGHMLATPSIWHKMFEDGWSGSNIQAICFGEEFDSELLNKLKTNCRKVWNVYGLSEAGSVCLCGKQQATEVDVSIGKPIQNMAVYILDRYMQPVPVGVVGEIYLRGVGIGKGYLKNKPLTEEKFVDNPFNSDQNDKLYRTGDLARFRADGNIQFVRYADGRIKSYGFRVELAEIENVLRMFDEVTDVHVLSRGGESLESRIIAYVVLNYGIARRIEQEMSFEQLLVKNLAEYLPEYMIPEKIVFLDELPITLDGKVDIAELPDVDESDLQNSVKFIQPSSQVETVLLGIWQDVLGIENISIRDDFFELGGHSLLAAQLITHIESKLKVDLPIHQIFETSTISDLGAYIEVCGD